MTYNLKIPTSKNVVFGAFGRSTDVTLSAGSSGNFTYQLTNSQSGTGVSASLSGGDVVLAQKDYIGFFVPYIANPDPVTVRILINGISIISQQEAIKPTAAGTGSASHITRSQPLFFTYSASSGDTLRIQYTKEAGTVLDMYSYATYGGNVLILWEIDK
jgi:hypothetical protein